MIENKITLSELFNKIEKGEMTNVISFETISKNLLITDLTLISYFDIYITADSLRIIKNIGHLDFGHLEFYKNDTIIGVLTVSSNEKIIIEKTNTNSIELKKELL